MKIVDDLLLAIEVISFIVIGIILFIPFFFILLFLSILEKIELKIRKKNG